MHIPKTHQYVCLGLLLISIVISSYLILFVITTTTDVIYEDVISNAIINRGFGAWPQLKFTFAPAYFPDFLGYYLVKLLINSSNVIINVYWATIFQILTFILALYCVFITFNVKRLTALISAITISTIGTTLAVYFPESWIWYHSTNDNLSSIILSLFCLCIVPQLLKQNYSITIPCIAFLLIISVISIISGRLFVLSFLAPTIVTFFCHACVVQNRKYRYNFFSYAFLLGVTYFITIDYFEHLINVKATASLRLGYRITALVSAKHLFNTLKELFTFSHFSYSILSYGWLLIFCYSLVDLIRAWTIVFTNNHTNKDYLLLQFLLIFFIFAMIINFVGPVLAGQFTGLISLRYSFVLLIYPFILITILNSTVLQNIPLLKVSYFKIIFLLFIVILLIINIFLIQQNTRSLADIVNMKTYSREQKVAECLDEYADLYQLKLGVGDYWHSYPIFLFSKKNIIVTPVYNNLSLCEIIDDGLLQSHSHSTPYNFIIVSNNKQFDFTESNILHTLLTHNIQPDKILDCENVDVKIFLFNDTRIQFNNIIDKEIEIYLEKQSWNK